ncbi:MULTISPECIES: MupA/Atu3671 family FMN-dependent luciferase-like monooxygenase [unclassified Bradyrhizobium]|uniref:MupA/Atu3671 family FMN-dependent luciferase-like monooxygenase n=1 Tax=unclassified Bradyrhizobium TaxID=2631580 RepID=UPI0029160F52|nr:MULTISPECIES: MupA/Atu3671 family FMN-dependent luciferase-like monooxygenase [unclassified Bradyrhizobium]
MKFPSFSLLFFSADYADPSRGKYDLLLSASKFADANGFEAVWMPERHFQPFGGIYANPAVTAAALATITSRVALRAGSVILPLHNPVRVAEEWAMVDHLSSGRAGVAFGSGWNVQDFVLAPTQYRERRRETRKALNVIKSLWAGERVIFENGAGNATAVATYPQPFQEIIPIWMTAESPETFVFAGEIGANVLTAMLHQSVEVATKNIKVYRETLEKAGFDPHLRTVTLMQHSFLCSEIEAAREQGFAAYLTYVKSNLALQEANARGLGSSAAPSDLDLDEQDITSLAESAFERHVSSTGLIGTMTTLRDRLDLWASMDVDEIACLVDFTDDPVAVHNTLEIVAKCNRP